MNYKADLPGGQKLLIAQEEGQTRISLQSDGDGHQRQASSFSTGAWKQSPTLFKSAKGAVLQIEAEQGQFFFQLEDNAIHRLNDAPATKEAHTLPLQKASDGDVEQPTFKAMEPMEPMKPLQSMKPSN